MGTSTARSPSRRATRTPARRASSGFATGRPPWRAGVRPVCVSASALTRRSGYASSHAPPGMVAAALDGDFDGTFPFEPRYANAGEVRLHYLDEGPRDAPALL